MKSRYYANWLVTREQTLIPGVNNHGAVGRHAGAAVSRLPNPSPPLARQARISGDVVLALRIRQDGSVDSLDVISSHPMLKDAALDSAKHSPFQCHDCEEALTAYTLSSTFGLMEFMLLRKDVSRGHALSVQATSVRPGSSDCPI